MKSPDGKSILLDVTKRYIAAGQFGRQAQINFSGLFRRHYSAAPLADRLCVAEMICKLRHVPYDVIMLLCCDADRIASTILTHSPLLDASELTTQILQGTTLERCAIAERSDLQPMHISQLLSYSEAPVALRLASNDIARAKLSPSLNNRLDRLSAMASTGLRDKHIEPIEPDAQTAASDCETPVHHQPKARETMKSVSKSPVSTQNDCPLDANTQSNEQPSVTDALLLDDHDLQMLNQLSESDWDAMDDDAVEAMARSLAVRDLANNGERMSFTIGAMDSENAPIPPLELLDESTREATIAFNIPMSERLDEIATAPANESALARLEVPVESASQALDIPAEFALSESEEFQSANSAKLEASKKPQITLTIRKSNQQEHEVDTDSAASAPSRINLNSATENDWLQALANLSETDHAQVSNGAEFPQTASAQAQKPATSQPSSEVRRPLITGRPLGDLPLQHSNQIEKRDNQTEVPTPSVESSAPLQRTGSIADLSLADLGLVEADPDLPSATDLLIERAYGSNPSAELVEPEGLDFIENGKRVALEDFETNFMSVVAKQLADERQTLHADEHEGIAKPIDMTELPALSEHRLVEVEEYETLKSALQTYRDDIAQTPIDQNEALGGDTIPNAIDLPSLLPESDSPNGAAEQFFAFDDETRLTLLQAILAVSLPEASEQTQNDDERVMLDEALAQELVMARFGNDRIRVADLMHDISGHRRLQMTQLLQDPGGEALVIYLYHIGLDESATMSMVLHGPDAISHDYAKVSRLMTLYNQLYPVAAEKIVKQLFGTQRATQAKHLTLHDDGAGQASPRFRKGGLQDKDQQDRFKDSPVFGRRTSLPE